MSFLSSALFYFSALLLGSLGAAFAGYGGMGGFALEGVMLLGGLAGVLSSHLPVWLCLPISGAAGMVYALFMLWIARRKNADQLLAGFSLCALAVPLALIAARLAGGVSYARKPFFFQISGENVPVFLPAALILFVFGWLVLRGSGSGLRLRYCGQDREKAENAGIRAQGMIFLAALVFGFLGGLGGTSALIGLGAGWRMEWGAGGLGFLALAALYLGRWKPAPTFFASAVLALAKAGADWAVKNGAGLPEGVPALAPYLIALILLMFLKGKNRAPAGVARILEEHPIRR